MSDIIEAADHIAEFIAGVDFQTFEDSEMLRSAVIQKLSVIGEAAARVSADLTKRHPEVPWAQIVAFRNILVHAYFGVDSGLVWRAATNRCPVLRRQIANMLAAEQGGPVEN